jgi:Kef-type K+ transport system membrane component KefB
MVRSYFFAGLVAHERTVFGMYGQLSEDIWYVVCLLVAVTTFFSCASVPYVYRRQINSTVGSFPCIQLESQQVSDHL